ncbi:hypothetical protein F5Y09DRAFT_295439 [Xylaria sp. FL1042]|nr:hypothetical protein F5Y09DRAFT_295439 [Xylaria sp. FL1042]
MMGSFGQLVKPRSLGKESGVLYVLLFVSLYLVELCRILAFPLPRCRFNYLHNPPVLKVLAARRDSDIHILKSANYTTVLVDRTD